MSPQNTIVARDAFVSVKLGLYTHYHFSLFSPQSCQMERDSLRCFSELLNFNQAEEDNALHTKHCHLFAHSVVHKKKGNDAPMQCIFVEDWIITFTHSLSSCC